MPKSVANTFVQTGQFVIQRLLASPPERICYKIIHKNSKPSVKRSLAVLDQYMADLFKKKSI
ncbi:Hypothetical protein LUCI_2171 [Lucifera butyrica]|uniref:LysR substrate-binding domain-containing protein n=1 Tax=Lucifera butyrica TaxID=1351585 RepID=A0A498R6V3_9FIRM|nr:Hypothetical protein LUCI_2171 [Lucifera butyrica]